MFIGIRDPLLKMDKVVINCGNRHKEHNSIAWLLWILSYDPRQCQQKTARCCFLFLQFITNGTPQNARTLQITPDFRSESWSKKTARIQLVALFNVVSKLQEPFSQIATIIRQKSAACLWAPQISWKNFHVQQSLGKWPVPSCIVTWNLEKKLLPGPRWIPSMIKVWF